MLAPKPPASDKGRIFLIDSMSFIFRAYHAMARQRSMSTKTGVPTAATYVFVNMLRKLREDFRPEYLAAVFDVGARTFRDQSSYREPRRLATGMRYVLVNGTVVIDSGRFTGSLAGRPLHRTGSATAASGATR